MPPPPKKPPPPPSMKPFLLMFAPMFLWILLLPFAPVIAAPLKPVLGPLAAHSFQGTIALLGVVSGSISVLLRFRFTDWRKVRAFQQKSQRIGKQLREAMKSQNKHLMQKAREEQMGMMREQQEMMTENMKPILLLLLVSLPFFMWIYATVPPSAAAATGAAALVDGCPSNVTLNLSVGDPNWSRNLSACGEVTREAGVALQYVATHCPYRTGMGSFGDHVRRCVEASTGGPFRVPPLGRGDSGVRYPADLALGFMPWWIVWYFLISMPPSHLLQKWMEDRMRRKERVAALASGAS